MKHVAMFFIVLLGLALFSCTRPRIGTLFGTTKTATGLLVLKVPPAISEPLRSTQRPPVLEF